MHACTRGVWLWPAAQYVDVPCPRTGAARRVALVVLDCQGVHDDEEDSLFCIAAALSSALVYSTMGAIDPTQLELVASS